MTNTVSGRYLEVSSRVTIHYTDHPAQNTERGVVVFVHGSGPGASGWSNFKFNVAAFQEAGFRCIVFDQPGYGLTSKPTDVDHTLDFFVENLVGLLDGLNIDKITLVGNSLGGAVSLGMALAHPQRVEKLILMAPGGIEERETYFQCVGIQEMVKFPMGSPEFTRDVLAELLTLLVHDPKHVTDELVQERWETLQIQNPHVLATMAIPNVTDQLHKIDCPVAVFWGTDDKFCPATGTQTILDNCPNVQAHLLNNCGHWVMVEYAEFFNRTCIDFLTHE
ncbi:2-hydroxy-6-oxo-6-phenylhexa-2,4-dienoate hydrolase [Aequoribacter fuscus]|uniref:2-hydroxy-6-oxo-6-phenylhexa-2,4-dienoate hydrolase n=1 Tax=Aequoribacter fuscus TaxID=2518989 RepID=F3L4P6_9GAMM|nr:alpha/beta hydrolase [Aequoribacter fuscus]EGG28694.1 2-hydroxy-6-oxo-6-phenylhexa-2,4-dienoate hydrolase [Aequoribacter fuscus]QHJ89150.1 alpha/beta fold hydrolase [Aequoribacter fuscus]